MSFWHILYLLLIYPLQLFFEVVFSIAFKNVNSYGYAIIWLSLVINTVVLPLYIRADKIQNEQNIIESKLAPGIKHIRSAFKGDERFMMLQMYYKINNYHPAMALRSAASLLLQVPFFMAAYNMLSTLRYLNGESFWFIRDLGQPDALFSVGGFSINVLPVLMTLINVVSGLVYTRGHSIREKIQVNGMAALFLVLLYNSPSGLAFYWLLNNVFSLVKNIVTAILNKYFGSSVSKLKMGFEKLFSKVPDASKENLFVFIIASLSTAIAVSVLFPSMAVTASVQEFVDLTRYDNPTKYLLSSFFIGLGVFIVWSSVIYGFLNKKGRTVFSVFSMFLLEFFIVNFYCSEQVMNLVNTEALKGVLYVLLLLVVFAISVFLLKSSKLVTNTVLVAAFICVTALGFTGIYSITNIYKDVKYPVVQDEYSFNLSTQGKNVVVIMLDRALGYTVMDELEMIPGLEEKFDGFTFYPNTVSYGAHTNYGSPALFGGYDYTPYMMNQRSDVLLEVKHDEALKTMPVLFGNEGYDVTFFNPPYAGYQFIPDLSVFDDVPNTKAYFLDNRFNELSLNSGEWLNSMRERDFFFFGICFGTVYGRDFLFDRGNYNNPNRDFYNNLDFTDFLDINGQVYKAINFYSFLRGLEDITNIVDNDSNTLMLMNSELAHENVIPFMDLVETDIDLNAYYEAANSRSNVQTVVDAYMANGLSLELIGEWFDYLREQGVYDNTRIIIVADHGFENQYWENSVLDLYSATENFNPVLMVKDFDSTGFTVSDEFMTNADTPYLATLGLIDNPVNPFTGNEITNFEGTDAPLLISGSHVYNVEVNNGTVFAESDRWYTIRDYENPFDPNNWVQLGQE